MQERFSSNPFALLSIVHCPKGKYYTIMHEDELLDYNNRNKSDEMRLVCRLSARELTQFHKQIPPGLFPELNNEQGKTDN